MSKVAGERMKFPRKPPQPSPPREHALGERGREGTEQQRRRRCDEREQLVRHRSFNCIHTNSLPLKYIRSTIYIYMLLEYAYITPKEPGLPPLTRRAPQTDSHPSEGVPQCPSRHSTFSVALVVVRNISCGALRETVNIEVV